MKKQNKKWLTLILAGLCATTLGVATASTTAYADETTGSETTVVEAEKYDITSIFSGKNGASAGANQEGEGKNAAGSQVAFTFPNVEAGKEAAYVKVVNNLAFKWFEGKNDAKYLTTKFAFDALNFNSITFKVESASSIGSEDGKTTNSVKFVAKEGDVYAYVFNGATDNVGEAAKVNLTEKGLAADQVVTLALMESKSGKFGSFGVGIQLAESEDPIYLGEFINVGANRSESVKIEAETSENAVVLLNEINGQKFNNLTDGKIVDTAAPVLVVNEELKGFQYGTAFALNFEKLDVLQGTSNLTEKKTFYQYNPATIAEKKYETLTTSNYFLDSVYYTNGTEVSTKKEGDTYYATSVRFEDDYLREFVSIQIMLGDKTFKNETGDYAKVVYDLSWYASNDEGAEEQDKVVVEKEGVDYIVITASDEGPSYVYITLNDKDKVNVLEGDAKKAMDAEAEAYQKDVTAAAVGLLAGSGSELDLPAVDWLIKDNGGYRNLQFTISYKTPSSTSAKSTTGSYNTLDIPTTEEGEYEFKVFATDKANNKMKYYLDDKLVDLTASNVWEIEEIPSFTFTIANSKIEVEEASGASARKSEKVLNETYTLSSFTVKGATSQKSDYALYRVDTTDYNGPDFSNALTNLKYSDVSKALDNLVEGTNKTYRDLARAKEITYMDAYIDIYAGLIANAVSADKAAVKACFKKVEAYNSKITEEDPEWEEYNKYNWNPSSKSFYTAEEGEYLIIADFWEAELPHVERAVAYKVVFVETEVDVAPGESEMVTWMRNNKVSVILFGVAGLMLVLIIILLLINPSDETLEDIDREVEEKDNATAKDEETVENETEETVEDEAEEIVENKDEE